MSTLGAEIERPLRLGELLAAAIRIYGSRVWPFLAVGAIQGIVTALTLSAWLPFWADVALLSLAFALEFAFVARIVAGDAAPAALSETAARLPVLLVLALVVAVPFYVSGAYLLLLVFSVLWLALTAFSIPAALLEGRGTGAGSALRRSVELARVEYLHALGVAAALVLAYLVFGVVVAALLFGFADNGRLAAIALAQIALAPFFFIGLTVLYFDQRARASERAARR